MELTTILAGTAALAAIVAAVFAARAGAKADNAPVIQRIDDAEGRAVLRAEALRAAQESALRAQGEASTRAVQELREAIIERLAENQRAALAELTRASAEARAAQDARLDRFDDSLKSFTAISNESFTKLRGDVAQQAKAQTEANAADAERLATRTAERLDAMNRAVLDFAQALANGLEGQKRALAELSAQLLKQGGEQSNAAQALLTQRLADLQGGLTKSLGELQAKLDAQLADLRRENEAKLERIRETVDEKLQGTLEKRLGESFRTVGAQLESVQKGLGEMQSLASGVGDLKRVLTNVSTRGAFGELQLARLIEEVLAPSQYERNVPTIPGSNERVEYAIKMPGGSDGRPVYLPVDSKFPTEDYQRLLDCYQNGDAAGVALQRRALEVRLRAEAKTIREKYVATPHTTEFAILFVPVEGLYAEALRIPGLVDSLNTQHRVTIAGPTTFLALLNSLQMGFRTLAIQKRSSDVWHLLGAVKTEFGKFGGALEAVGRKLDEAKRKIDDVGVRQRAMNRQLRTVESLDEAESARLLGAETDVPEEE